MSEPAAEKPTLPAWAQVTEKRRAHIGRVTALLDAWADRVATTPGEARTMRDAGLLHDALRDASEAELRALATEDGAPDADTAPVDLLHGPAAAAMLTRVGESRADLVDAVRWHTLGSPTWGRVGRALYLADFLEPGRKFLVTDRAYLAAQVPHDFDGTFRQVVRLRLQWSLAEGKQLYAPTVELWNAVR
ncbi:phosphohydrolase [Gemmatimonadetes bacterium T265]|nr:phosphohydrolase [Gemmatimonadetes bacterium T265]